MSVRDRMEKLSSHISKQASEVNDGDAHRFIKMILGAERIFLAGAGRSGLVAGAFGMRLMHLGFTTYVVGDVVTPAIGKRDLLILVSGSGKSPSIIAIAKTSKVKGAQIAALTSFSDSPVGILADQILQIRGRRAGDPERDYLDRQLAGDLYPIPPLGTLFELSAAVFLDAIIDELMEVCCKKEDELKARHTNLE